MKFHAERNLHTMPIPRLIWFFEGEHVQVGAHVSNTYTDPVLSASVSFELSERNADRLAQILTAVGRFICRIIGHHYEAVSYPPNTPENPRDHLWFGDIEQCTRCFHTISIGDDD